jgi:YegS/Rv2252/BmrU family lipid kinase
VQRRILYIINPISGTGGQTNLKEIIERETKKAGFPFFIYPSVADGDYSFLREIIKEKKITDVVIAGGDGTINGVVASLKKEEVQFGILPLGSGNGLAFSAGIPKDIVKALGIVFRGHSKITDAFLINNSFACMLCGLGFDAQVAHDFADAPKRGLITYVRKTIKNFITATTYPFVLTADGKEISTEAFFISIANSNQFGNNFTIAPKASLTDGLLDIVIMTKQSKLGVLFETVKQISGYNKVKTVDIVDENAGLIYFQTDKLLISNEGDAPMHIDGDPVETMQQLKVKMLKGCFRMVQ